MYDLQIVHRKPKTVITTTTKHLYVIINFFCLLVDEGPNFLDLSASIEQGLSKV